MLKYVLCNVIKARDDYFEKTKKEDEVTNDADFAVLEIDNSWRQLKLRNELNVHNYLHKITGMKPILIDNNGVDEEQKMDQLDKSQVNQVKNQVNHINHVNNRRQVIDPINEFNVNNFPVCHGLGYFMLTFCFNEKAHHHAAANDNEKLKLICSIFNKKCCSSNVIVEKVYHIDDDGDRSNKYCIIVSSFELEIRLGIYYHFGHFVFGDPLNVLDPEDNPNTTHVVLTRPSYVFCCFFVLSLYFFRGFFALVVSTHQL